MSTEPLHVQTARALRWTEIENKDGSWWGTEPHGHLAMAIPHYDRSWCSAGALVNRYHIGLMWDHGQWVAQHSDPEGRDAYQGGESPTEAVCRLVVTLAKESRLKE